MTLKSVRRPVEAPPRRMDPLSTLPVFVALDGKRVVVAGGSEAAAWKAELVAAAGAHVEVFAAAPVEGMVRLERDGTVAGTVRIVRREWDTTCLAHASMAICDAASEGEAQAFQCAARAAGVPANVIDRPEFCTFQFGSIVNRSPLVVGISTTGAAPILGQAVRRRIETLLPPALVVWAGLAARVRRTVLERLDPGRPRRAFWDRFVDHAFSGAQPDEAEAVKLVGETDTALAGKVTLVGAGPGDPGLLTLNAMRALQGCDVILFDDLVSDEVLELARREAKRISVGKRGARESCRQDDITAMMIKLAKAGRSVVRLKAGDPSIFGRSGEEISALRSEGIEVDVIAGVTSASAMAARLGTSLTHRDHAQVVSFMTGHARNGVFPDSIDLGAALGPGRTAMVYMGARTASQWVARAMEEGASPATPAVAMASVSGTNERVWRGPLAALPDNLPERDAGPILIGVGEVFGAVAEADLPLPQPAELERRRGANADRSRRSFHSR
ncbi:MAG: siroheme synthase CysG [Pseudomonadota bacterium]